MTPIVHGLQAEFGEKVSFIFLDARDGGDGQHYFEGLKLPGHPSIVIFDASGNEIYRAFGVTEAAALRQVVMEAG